MSKHLIDLKGLRKEYDGVDVLKNIDLYIRDGEFLTLLGPSGCGKTTMLRLIAGFALPSSGQVIMDGKDMSRVPPYKRRVNTVFQKYALFPHLNVYDNIAFGLKIQKLPKAEIQQRVEEMLELVNLKGYEKRWIEQLSGGQQQRVALARTLAQNPKIILADEPVAALDPVTAKQVMEDFVRINQDMDISILLNIHHVELALTYANRIIGIRSGKIVFDGPAKAVTQEVLNAIYEGHIPQGGEDGQ